MKRFLLVLTFGLGFFLSCGKNEEAVPEEDISWCVNYSPGERTSFPTYSSLADKIAWGVVRSDYEAYLTAAEKEATSALYQAFKNSNETNSQIFYGSYNGPGESAEDEGQGFRVIRLHALPEKSGQKRVAWIIMFYEFREGKLMLRSGEDVLRIRVQIGDAGDRSMMGLSYAADVDGNGTVSNLRPTTFFAEGRRNDRPAVVPSVGNHGCFFCHSTFERRSRKRMTERAGMARADVTELPYESSATTAATNPDIAEFLSKIPAASRGGIEPLFADPRATFVPGGMLAAISRRCVVTK